MALLLSAFEPGDRAVSVSELARRTGLAKSTVSRIAGDLVAHRFLERTGAGLRLGIRVFELGELAARPRDLRKLALASMTDLRNAVNLTVHLAILEGGEVVYIEILPVKRGPRLPSRVGGRMPAHATGVGKALLALTPDETIDDFIAGGLRKVGPQTITDPEKLWRELARIRASGISYEREESGPGIACAAAAIRGAGGEPIAALSAAGWAGEFDPRRIGPAVQTAALALSRGLSRRPGLRFSAYSSAEDADG
ncbi:IclR family transcriptional regulator [Leucobacter sp. CSA1]|uniref:IclR family transcriptional regulator n=1 Tax=Leucobacter chromiisoli TaxID=2796471 RepID=A0A934Q7Q5_9MICO|nr:IclR family transcriptional regulator [Leucobacter chromiisoli]